MCGGAHVSVPVPHVSRASQAHLSSGFPRPRRAHTYTHTHTRSSRMRIYTHHAAPAFASRNSFRSASASADGLALCVYVCVLFLLVSHLPSSPPVRVSRSKSRHSREGANTPLAPCHHCVTFGWAPCACLVCYLHPSPALSMAHRCARKRSFVRQFCKFCILRACVCACIFSRSLTAPVLDEKKNRVKKKTDAVNKRIWDEGTVEEVEARLLCA